LRRNLIPIATTLRTTAQRNASAIISYFSSRIKEMDMSSQNLRPKWWQLYLVFPLLIGLFAVDHRLNISTRGHQVAQIGILLVIYGLVHLWLRANAKALSRMGQSQSQGTITVIRVPPSQFPDEETEKRSLLYLPDSEVKGILSATFEADYIDMEAFPVDEIPEESKKEQR
jgi:hypothetical protein